MNTLVDISRLQFGVSAMYHFIFVPLTLGLTWILVIMEAIYLKTGKEIYKDMTKFWGKLFGINFAIGITTGLTLEFQFGTNWAYYSHYVGDIFGAPLAIEGLMAFFLESTFVGMFFFSWDKVSKKTHFLFTVLVAIGSNLSALWILVANGWMQHPIGTVFNPVTMRMELNNFFSVLNNPVAQAKFFHTVSSGYVTASIFVLAVSSFYLIRKKNLNFFRRSFKIAAIFGLWSTLAVIAMGDMSGLAVLKDQPSKLAAIEGYWKTEKAPFGWSLFAVPNEQEKKNDYNIAIPYVGSLILTHNFHTDVIGIEEIIAQNKQRIINGQKVLLQLNDFYKDKSNTALAEQITQNSADIGFGLLLKKYTNDVSKATPEMINKAAIDTVPKVMPLFYTFRLMVFLGMSFLLLFAISAFLTRGNRTVENHKWLLTLSMLWLPTPWLAVWCGWFVAEYGRQPWTIFEILPTFTSVSSLSVSEVTFSFIGFVVIYSILAIIEIWLMVKYIKLGPSVINPLYSKNN
ncbi:cytochrome ubiquinol oxidase subunit I [Rickettsiales bacterium LUAb2]